MDKKQKYVSELAKFLSERDMTMSANELVNHLNRNGFKTTNGNDYQTDKRGIFKLLGNLFKKGDKSTQDAVTKAFVKEDGTYAYDD